MDGDSITKLPVAERRGCWEDDCGNTWEAVLLAGDFDAVAEGLKKSPEIGLVKRDVTQQVLAGECPVPDGRWALLVQLVGSDWITLADPTILNPFTREIGLAERLAKESGLKLLQTGYQDTAAATYVSVYTGPRRELFFESTGAGFRDDPLLDATAEEEGEDDDEDEYEYAYDDFDRTVLTSDQYAEDWWQQFSSEGEVQQALLRDLEAYVPFLQAYPQDDKISLAACHEDVVSPEHIKRIDLVVFGATASAEPNPASRQLADAIAAGDLAGVQTALEAGADLQALPGLTCSPLAYAVQNLKEDHVSGAQIVAAVLQAGANAAEETAGKGDPPLIEAVGKAKQNPQQALEVINLLLDAGADINKAGKPSLFGGGPPLHEAVQQQSLATIMLLHERGADLGAVDMVGNTALARAEGMLKSVTEHLNPKMEVTWLGADDTLKSVNKQLDDETARRTGQPIQAIVEYLQKADAGQPAGDWQAQAASDRIAYESERRRMLAAGERFKRGMEKLGQQLDEVEAAEKSQPSEALKQAIEAQPAAVTLAPHDDEAAWRNQKQRDAAVQQLTDLGFEHFGDFAINEMPGVLIRALLNESPYVYAAVCQAPVGPIWVDLVRFHGDGSTLTVTNGQVSPGVDELSDGTPYQKIFLSGKDVDSLWRELLEADADNTAEVLTADEFTARFENFYAADLAAKKSKLAE